MVAVVLADLTGAAKFTYRQPVLDWAKEQYSQLVTLDLDAASEPALPGMRRGGCGRRVSALFS